MTGFAAGAYGTYAPTRDSGAWNRLTGDKLDQLGVIGVNARKGLPFGFDVGGFYGFVPGSDAHVYGGNVDTRCCRLYAPARAALRGSYTGTSNLGDIDFTPTASMLQCRRGSCS